MNIIILFTALTIINTILQTVKSLCTIRCSTFISACVNALAYGLYTFVIFFTTADGMSLWVKAAITAIANFFGIYVANAIFDKLFTKTTRWKIEVSIPSDLKWTFEYNLKNYNLDYYQCGWFKDWAAYAIFCPNKDASKALKEILPLEAKYNVVECVKRL